MLTLAIYQSPSSGYNNDHDHPKSYHRVSKNKDHVPMWIVILIVIVAVIAAYYWYPPFGGRSNKHDWQASDNFNGKIFVNQVTTSVNIKLRDSIGLLHAVLSPSSNRYPKSPIESRPVDIEKLLSDSQSHMLWLGHSTVLMHVDGKTIITDPILSNRASPFPFIGPKRLISRLSITTEQLPAIDVVLISHDHYDHLDYATIRAIKDKVGQFCVPLGIAAHLRRWGVRDDQITELDWWQETVIDEILFAFTPARHFSGRTATDRAKTLWGSWVIHSSKTRLFFSGDSGYGEHFKQIGKKYGPFDITLMECGQYNELWRDVHMLPEQTVAAHQDVRGKNLIPIHWGAFSLAVHSWTEPARRVEDAATLANVTLVTPELGEIIPLNKSLRSFHRWWREL